jgi:hypothetical protein
MKIKRYIGKDNSLIFVNKSKTNFSLKLHPLKRKKDYNKYQEDRIHRD